MDRSQVKNALDEAGGVLRLEPSWVPRSFMIPGERLKLHPRRSLRPRRPPRRHQRALVLVDDQRRQRSRHAGRRGAQLRPPDRAAAVPAEGRRREAGDLLLGATVMEREKGWNLLCKFFDNMGPIPHHMHQSDEQAKLLGRRGKPEAYYFPPQYNQTDNNFPHTFMGLEPGTTKADVRRCLENWNKGDNGILFLSRAYRLEPGTGWQIDPGILHAPGSLVTYEPQVNSDVFAMFQSEVEGRITPWALLIKDVPAGAPRRSRLPRRAARLGRQRQPALRRRQPLLPEAGPPFAETEPRGLPRAVDQLRHRALLRQGAHRAAGAHGHDQGRRRLRADPDAGLRHVRLARRSRPRR